MLTVGLLVALFAAWTVLHIVRSPSFEELWPGVDPRAGLSGLDAADRETRR